MTIEKEDKFIKELMGKSVVKMPFDDFEEKLMLEIHKEAKTSHSFLKDIKLSWFFFVVGTLFGLVLSIGIGEMDKTILGLSVHSIGLFIEALFVILLLLQFDKLIRLIKNGDIQ
ncbi:MAG: hypothetical protein M0R39_09775 [Prolixibacteraceae bacterium]|jgi:hypothetical protein|nr:hypothetical protein [Prolixibacteraceae bacterium]